MPRDVYTEHSTPEFSWRQRTNKNWEKGHCYLSFLVPFKSTFLIETSRDSYILFEKSLL
jgi:hypothetical protein